MSGIEERSQGINETSVSVKLGETAMVAEVSSAKQEKPLSPNNFKYYNKHINKMQFNHILVESALALLKMLYPSKDFSRMNLRFFIVEILRRSKTSIQTLQITCYYVSRLVAKENQDDISQCPKKLFLGLLIIASKFNQDQNYNFKTWLKICGCHEKHSEREESSNEYDLNIQALRKVEIQCLQALNYECYINDDKYENWCNILCIYGYDLIKQHNIFTNEITWERDLTQLALNFDRWRKVLKHFYHQDLSIVKVSFGDYYVSQFGTKIIVEEAKEGQFLKRKHRLVGIDSSNSNVKLACR